MSECLILGAVVKVNPDFFSTIAEHYLLSFPKNQFHQIAEVDVYQEQSIFFARKRVATSKAT